VGTDNIDGVFGPTAEDVRSMDIHPDIWISRAVIETK
jgi:hypothetical protein